MQINFRRHVIAGLAPGYSKSADSLNPTPRGGGGQLDDLRIRSQRRIAGSLLSGDQGSSMSAATDARDAADGM